MPTGGEATHRACVKDGHGTKNTPAD